jgi:hypothetical protein
VPNVLTDMDLTGLCLAPVNRYAETLDIVTGCMAQWEAREKVAVCFASQHSGVGKTNLGENLVRFLRLPARRVIQHLEDIKACLLLSHTAFYANQGPKISALTETSGSGDESIVVWTLRAVFSSEARRQWIDRLLREPLLLTVTIGPDDERRVYASLNHQVRLAIGRVCGRNMDRELPERVH